MRRRSPTRALLGSRYFPRLGIFPEREGSHSLLGQVTGEWDRGVLPPRDGDGRSPPEGRQPRRDLFQTVNLGPLDYRVPTPGGAWLELVDPALGLGAGDPLIGFSLKPGSPRSSWLLRAPQSGQRSFVDSTFTPGPLRETFSTTLTESGWTLLQSSASQTNPLNFMIYLQKVLSISSRLMVASS